MKIVELSPRENYTLFLRYEDGTEGVVDLSSLAGRGVFASWLVPGVFEQAKLSDSGVPEWPGVRARMRVRVLLQCLCYPLPLSQALPLLAL